MMKVLLWTAIAAAAIICMPTVGGAIYDENQLGIFFDPAAAVDEIAIEANSQQVLYLVLLNPVNESYEGGGGRNVSFVGGFECGIVPPSGDYLLGVDFPLPAINVGGTGNIVAAYGTGLPVGSGRAAMLASLRVLTKGDNRAGYRLRPASPPSHAGVMAYLDAEDTDDNLVDMHPVSGGYDTPVFWFGDWHIKEQMQWGDVKSLFR